MTPTFFSVSLFSSTCSCGRVKKIKVFMFKIPDFSLAPRPCKQAGLHLVSAWKDLDPRTLVSGDLRHFCMTVRCAAHCAGATLNVFYRLRTVFKSLRYWSSSCKQEAYLERFFLDRYNFVPIVFTSSLCKRGLNPASVIELLKTFNFVYNFV